MHGAPKDSLTEHMCVFDGGGMEDFLDEAAFELSLWGQGGFFLRVLVWL